MMNSSAKIAAVFAAATLTAAALAGCTPTGTDSDAPTKTAAAVSQPPETLTTTSPGPQPTSPAPTCTPGIDSGTRTSANGGATLGSDGYVTSYVVAPGDGLYAIGDRFCLSVDTVTAEWLSTCIAGPLHPGDVLPISATPPPVTGDCVASD